MKAGIFFAPAPGVHAVRLALFFFAALVPAASAKPLPAPAPSVPANADRYYFSIDIDPRYQIVGTGVLPPELAPHANCYRFSYDAEGKLKRVEYYRAGVASPDPLFQVPRIDFDYQKGLEHRWYRDDQGQPVENADEIAGEELALNPAGYPVSVTNLDASGGHTRDSRWVIQYVRTLDKFNRLVRARRTGLLGVDLTDNNGYFETRTVYDDQGRSIEYGNYDSSGNPLNDSDGVALTRTTYVLYPNATQVTESYFDASGMAVAEKSSGVHQRQRVYDRRGLTISEAYFDVTGAPAVDNDLGVHEQRSEYDDRANLLVESFLGVDGKLSDIRSKDDQEAGGYARVVYQYDDENRVVRKSYFGDDGAPQVLLSLGAATIQQEYDGDGNMSRRAFFDGQGNPVPHRRYGAPAISIKVQGDTTIISLRDAQDRPMANPEHGFAELTYKTATDKPLTRHNHFYNLNGRPMSKLRVFVINPHLYALTTEPAMEISARGGAIGAGIGAFIAMAIAFRKARATRRAHVYVPTPVSRFFGWFAIFAIGEGMIRFFITVWWSYLHNHNGALGPTVYVVEDVFIAFFLYRLLRMRVTMRVLNVTLADIHGIIREYFSQAGLDAKWLEERRLFVSADLDVRLRYFPKKAHAYLAFHPRDAAGRKQAHDLARYIREQAGTLEGPPMSRTLAFYYPSVALCYFLLGGTAFYTLWQMVKAY
jgi:hypothetical protein